MASKPRMTPQTKDVLRLLMQYYPSDVYGRRVANETGLATGTVSLILDRLQRRGWLRDWSEQDAAQDLQRPQRRYYGFTELGFTEARDALRSSAKL
jgi:DNA-binding PadR family transcriptional regulator